jgi:hypothetical protein
VRYTRLLMVLISTGILLGFSLSFAVAQNPSLETATATLSAQQATATIMSLYQYATFAAGGPITDETPAPDPDPLDWPLPVPTADQIDDGRVCNATLKDLVLHRPFARLVDTGATANPPTACDWVVVAQAYLARKDQFEPAPANGKRALQNALSLNPAVAVNEYLLDGYQTIITKAPFYGDYGYLRFVKAPPFASQPITQAEIQFVWDGGEEEPVQKIEYTITIAEADSKYPLVTGTLKTRRKKGVYGQYSTPIANDGSIRGTIDPALIQALGPSLVDLIPVNNLVRYADCVLNHPDWHVKLNFKDGTQLEMVTNKSTLYFSGGPWQTTIAGQKYIQFGTTFLSALESITDALKMPHGTISIPPLCDRNNIFDHLYGEVDKQ